MSLRVAAAVSIVLGGACWMARLVRDLEALEWAGAALLVLGFVLAGAALVARGALALRLLVAVLFPVLAVSVHALLRGLASPLRVDAAVGAVLALAGVLALLRRPAPAAEPAPSPAGGHRARSRRHGGNH